MQVSTVFRFLIGQRQAIIDIANCRSALWVGATFVLSAGFAREYNQEDLLQDPWYVLVPLVASLSTSFVLYCLFYLGSKQSAETVEFLPSYRRFLTLYWMTAPLAWLYAIPVELFLSAADSVRANLTLLGLVSLWRVLLISRCASVLFGASYLTALFIVMFFADTLTLGILYFAPLPIINVMGGIPLTESEGVIVDAALIVGFFGGISWLIWLISAIVALTYAKAWQPRALTTGESSRVSRPLWVIATLSVLGWAIVLPMTQPAQQLRRQVEADLLNDRAKEGLMLMSSHDRGDFPPHWDPPPWSGYGQQEPSIGEMVSMLQDPSSTDWVVEIYREKITRQINRTYSEDRKKQLRALLEKLDHKIQPVKPQAAS